MNVQTAWVVEYSPNQQLFNCTTLEHAVTANRNAFQGGRVPEYVPLAITRSHDECRAFLEAWQQTGHSVNTPVKDIFADDD